MKIIDMFYNITNLQMFIKALLQARAVIQFKESTISYYRGIILLFNSILRLSNHFVSGNNL